MFDLDVFQALGLCQCLGQRLGRLGAQIWGLEGFCPEGARFLEGKTGRKDIGLSKNRGGPLKFSIINHPFWGAPIFGNTHMFFQNLFKLKGY